MASQPIASESDQSTIDFPLTQPSRAAPPATNMVDQLPGPSGECRPGPRFVRPKRRHTTAPEAESDSASNRYHTPRPTHRHRHSGRKRKHKNKKQPKAKGKKHCKKRTRHRHSPSSSPSSSSSSTSSSSSSESESGESSSSYTSTYMNKYSNDEEYKNLFVPPSTAFGSQVATNVPSNIVKRIRNNEYVDFADFIPNNIDQIENDTMSLEIDSQNNPRFIKKRNAKSITFFQWSMAFDAFIIIYLQEHLSLSVRSQTKLLRELLTYRKNISDIVRQGGEWANYDKHFRTEMGSRGDKWSTIRFDLQLFYNINKKQKVFTTSHAQIPKSRITSPLTGHCFAYNTQGTRCNNSPCQYKHICQKCNLTHPAYACRSANIAPYRSNYTTGSNKGNNSLNPISRIQRPMAISKFNATAVVPKRDLIQK